MRSIRIFVSYSHRDPSYLGDDSLLGFLKGLEREEDVEFWTDEGIEAGTLWNEQIHEQLRTSDIALVLVSQSFLDSRYCSDIEVSAFLKRCRDDGMIIFPIILSPCEWERQEWIASRQFLPGGTETIEEHYTEAGPRKRLYLRIRQELRASIQRARERRASESAQGTAARVETHLERTQVTVLACELVPTEPDGGAIDPGDLPEVVHELSGEFQQVCTNVFSQFEGQIVQPASGRVTVLFGHPIAHEDDSRRAVRAALALIETLDKLSARIEREVGVRLALRAGVHTGMVVAETGGEDVLAAIAESDTIVTAERVRELAAINAVVVSEATRELVADYFETTETESVSVGSARQIWRVHRVVRDTGFQSRVEASVATHRLSELVGREQELQILLDRWKEARLGNGRVVMMRAEAGVGKSRLVAELKSRTAAEERHWIECRCSPYHENSALYPIVGVVQFWLGIDPNEPDESKLDKLESHLARYGGNLEESVPLVASLLSIPFERRYKLPALNPREQKELTLEVLAQIVIDQALEKPVAFVVEDLHWVDPSTVEFLNILVEQAATFPILILFSFRPEQDAPAQWSNLPYTSQITLGRLDAEAVRRMTLVLGGGKSLPPEVFDEIFAKTEGVPLFVEDLTRMVIESGMIEERDGKYELAGPFQSLAIPATLQETLMARLAKLATAKPVAQVGATIGREFVFEMLRDVGGFDDKTLLEELNRLVSAGLLYRRGLLSRAKYIFKHALVQEALQQSLVNKQRRHYHKVIGEILEEKFPAVAEVQPELVAYHYAEGGMYAKAVAYWQRAAERALAHCANREALSHARHAIETLQRLPENEERYESELALRAIEGPSLLALKGWAAPELGECYHRAREVCLKLPRTQKLFTVLRGIWKNQMVPAHLHQALAIAEELRAMASGDEDLLLEGHGALCDTLFWLGRPTDSREQARLGFELYDLDRHHTPHSVAYGEDPATMFYTYSALSLALMGQPGRSLEFTQGAINALNRFSHTHSRAFLLCGIAWNYIQLRNVDAAGRYAQKLIDISVENHFDAWRPIGEAMKGWAIAASGSLEEGTALMKAGRTAWHATGAGVKACFYPA
ncbi:MAG TPA: AAA family ATPase, partial [Thermoanaerobaculia bacterium]|nr:AAA family ATPase [Thermoanaerobaculia bacterium]